MGRFLLGQLSFSKGLFCVSLPGMLWERQPESGEIPNVSFQKDDKQWCDIAKLNELFGTIALFGFLSEIQR